MSTVITWSLRLQVKSGKLDDFRALMEEMVESTQAEPGAEIYEWYIDETESAVHIIERYADSPSTLAHLATFGEKFAARFLDCVDPTGFDVYGEPDEQVREALAGFGPSYLGPLGGFAR